jgi:hypothetical protein
LAGELRLVELSRDRAGLRRFLRVPYRIYRDDPHWVAPLLSDRRQVLGAGNPFFTHARMALWVATREGREVGSVAGIVDEHHNARHGEATAFFGFFESIDDPAVSRLLLDAVRAWARRLGMTRLLGPMNPSINEECGLLVEGFDAPPVIMMTYNPAYYAGLLAQAGLTRSPTSSSSTTRASPGSSGSPRGPSRPPAASPFAPSTGAPWRGTSPRSSKCTTPRGRTTGATSP